MSTITLGPFTESVTAGKGTFYQTGKVIGNYPESSDTSTGSIYSGIFQAPINNTVVTLTYYAEINPYKPTFTAVTKNPAIENGVCLLVENNLLSERRWKTSIFTDTFTLNAGESFTIFIAPSTTVKNVSATIEIPVPTIKETIKTNSIFNRISKDDYNNLLSSGTVTAEMQKEQLWMGHGRLVTDDEIDEVKVYTATHSKSGTVHTLAGLPVVEGIYTVQFRAKADFAEGNTFGGGYTAKPNGEETTLPDKAFVAGDIVSVTVDVSGKKLGFKLGGKGFPDGWNQIITAKTREHIQKFTPVISKKENIIEDGVKQANSSISYSGGSIEYISFDPTGTYLVVAHSGSPYLTIYKRSGGKFTKLPDLDLTLKRVYGVAFDPSGTYLVLTHSDNPYLSIYKRSSDTFTKLANPSFLPADSIRSAAFDPSGTYLVVTHSGSPHFTIYKRNGDIFTKLVNSPVSSDNVAYRVAFAPTGTYLALALFESPFITIYKRSGDTFTKLSNPSALPTYSANNVAFDPTGTYLAVAQERTPYLTIYKRSGDRFTELGYNIGSLTDRVNDVSFDPTGTYLAVASWSSPYIIIYKRSGDTFTKVANPDILPTGIGRDVSFDPSGTYLVLAHNSAPDLTIYKTKDLFLYNTLDFSNPLAGDYGFSLETKQAGEVCRANLFPAINQINQ